MGRVTLLILATLTLYLSLFFLAVDVRLRCSSPDLFISGPCLAGRGKAGTNSGKSENPKDFLLFFLDFWIKILKILRLRVALGLTLNIFRFT